MALPVQLISYGFTTVENPLSDGGNFSSLNTTFYTDVLFVPTSGRCGPDSSFNNTGSFYSGTGWLNNQYSQVTIHSGFTSNNADALYLFLRQGSDPTTANNYVAEIAQQSPNSAISISATVNNNETALFNTATGPLIHGGDVWVFSIIGNVLTLSRNGTVVASTTDPNFLVTSGAPGFGFVNFNVTSVTQASNWTGGQYQVATPTFSPPAGTYFGPQSVTISSDAGSTIYYTTDGSTPTTSSTLYTGPVTISTMMTLKAIAIASQELNSSVGSASYIITFPPTLQTIIQGRFKGTSVTNAFPQNNKMKLDLMQIVNPNGGQLVWKLDYQGNVVVNPASGTDGTLLGQFLGSSWTEAFIENNTNPYQFDIIQVANEYQVVWWLDYSGTVHT